MKLQSLRIFSLACALALAAPAGSAAQIDTSQLADSAVVQMLPGHSLSAEQRGLLRRQALQARAQPQHLPLALLRARQALSRAREHGDPRELGHAQAVLGPWWTQAAPAPAVRLLKASILQGQHQFGLALQELQALHQAGGLTPSANAQARLIAADIHRVQGHWQAAQTECQQLLGEAAAQAELRRVAALCLADLAGLQADPAAARHWLQQAQRGSLSEAERGWLAQLQAEHAALRGEPGLAQRLFEEALRLSPHAQLRAAYADSLLQAGRFAEVEALLAPHAEASGSQLLRLAMARRQLKSPLYEADRATLQAQFDAAARRGDSSHARERALFDLHLQGRAQSALAWAQRNWAEQREPLDACLLIASAAAAGQPQAAQEAQRIAQRFGWCSAGAMPKGRA